MASFRPGPAANPSREKAKLEEQIPSLENASYRVTSDSTPRYNCVAWALGDYDHNWSPAVGGGYRWPDDLDPWPTATVVEELFARRDFKSAGTSDRDPEPGVERVAIFVDGAGEVSHVAYQPPGGKWTGKMGDLADIEHDELEAVASGLGGRLLKIMRRELPAAKPKRLKVVRSLRDRLRKRQ